MRTVRFAAKCSAAFCDDLIKAGVHGLTPLGSRASLPIEARKTLEAVMRDLG